MNYLLLISLILASCAPKSLGPGFKDFAHKSSVRVNPNRLYLFPQGIYSHRITIIDSEGKKREFRGFLSLGEHEIRAVGLSMAGTTFFRLSENLVSKKISYRFYYPVSREFKKKFVTVYSSMKKIFLLPLRKNSNERDSIIWFNANGLPSRYTDPQQRVMVTIDRYDKNGIPLTLSVHYKNFSVLIGLDGYQLGNSDDLSFLQKLE